jgi:hypothetical protein
MAIVVIAFCAACLDAADEIGQDRRTIDDVSARRNQI